MSYKFDKFLVELRALCISHKVMLSVSDYDALVVNDLLDPNEDPLYVNGIEDRTWGKVESE